MEVPPCSGCRAPLVPGTVGLNVSCTWVLESAPDHCRAPARAGAQRPIARLPRSMAPRSLRPQLNQIRAWVRQGRTDAWIAHQLEVTVQQIQAFKRDQGLEPGDDSDSVLAAPDYDDEIDLRAEDDALIAAELEAAEAESPEEEEGEEERGGRRRRRRGGR